MSRTTLFTFLALAAAACGGDSGTEPTPNANVAGDWRFSWANMSGAVSGASVTCTGVLDFTVTQTGSTFSGIQEGTGRFICVSGGQTIVDEVVGGETLINGQINGTQVSFRLGTVPGAHSGIVSGTSMSGTGAWQFDLGGTTLNLNGQWSAAKF